MPMFFPINSSLFEGDSWFKLVLFMRISPVVGLISPANKCKKVVLPTPDFPVITIAEFS